MTTPEPAPAPLDPKTIGRQITLREVAAFATCSSLAINGCRGTGIIVSRSSSGEQRVTGNCKCAWLEMRKVAGWRVALLQEQGGWSYWWKKGMEPENIEAFERLMRSIYGHLDTERFRKTYYVELSPGRWVLGNSKILVPWARIGSVWFRARWSDIRPVYALVDKHRFTYPQAKELLGEDAVIGLSDFRDHALLDTQKGICDYNARADGYTLCR